MVMQAAAIGVSVGILGLIGALAQDGGAEPSAGPKAVLTRIQEQRAVEIVKPDDQMMRMSGNEPKLVLRFTLVLPEGVMVSDVEQPKAVQAKDSTGKDLSKIEPGFRNERTFVEMQTRWNEDDADEFEFVLLPALRKAETFSLRTTFGLHVYTGTTATEIKPTGDWMNLDKEAFGGMAVRVRLDDPESPSGLEVRPVEARNFIERIEQMVDDEWSESNGWMADGRTITYMLPGGGEGPVQLRLHVRTGSTTIPVEIALEDQALP